MSPDGDVVDGQWKVVEPTQPTPPPPAAQPQAQGIGLTELVERYGAEAIMAANDGAIPRSDEEVAAVAQKLGASNG
jgi:hypothetical protein